jgi:proteasome-associated ATPase
VTAVRAGLPVDGGEKGVSANDLLRAVREEFKENEDLRNTTNPDDWAKRRSQYL